MSCALLCLRCNEDELTPKTSSPGSIYDVPLNIAQAGAGRDALAKAICALSTAYASKGVFSADALPSSLPDERLFQWIVDRVNVSMKPRGPHQNVVGVLDIYGCVLAALSQTSFSVSDDFVSLPVSRSSRTTRSSSSVSTTSTRSVSLRRPICSGSLP